MGRLSDSRSPTGLPTERPARRVPPRAGAQGDPRPAADNASASPVTAAEAAPPQTVQPPRPAPIQQPAQSQGGAAPKLSKAQKAKLRKAKREGKV